MSAHVLLLEGGRSACVGYHMLCMLWYAWMDKDVEITYSAVQVNHNHDYRSSNQANFVNYPRLYQTHKNIRMFDLVYACFTASAWFGVSCLPALDPCSVAVLCFACFCLRTSVPVRSAFVVAFLSTLNLRFIKMTLLCRGLPVYGLHCL